MNKSNENNKRPIQHALHGGKKVKIGDERNIFRCDLCNVSVNSIINLEEHKMSAAHKRNMHMIGRSLPIPHKSDIVVGINIHDSTGDEFYFDPKATLKYRCITCERYLPDLNAMDNHVLSKKHISTLKFKAETGIVSIGQKEYRVYHKDVKTTQFLINNDMISECDEMIKCHVCGIISPCDNFHMHVGCASHKSSIKNWMIERKNYQQIYDEMEFPFEVCDEPIGKFNDANHAYIVREYLRRMHGVTKQPRFEIVGSMLNCTLDIGFGCMVGYADHKTKKNGVVEKCVYKKAFFVLLHMGELNRVVPKMVE